jgi:hypothetical protein
LGQQQKKQSSGKALGQQQQLKLLEKQWDSSSS